MPRKTTRRAQTRTNALRKTLRPKPKAKGGAVSREKVRPTAPAMRARGFRLVQMWIANSNPFAVEDQAWVDSISWWNTEEAAEQWTTDPAKRS